MFEYRGGFFSAVAVVIVQGGARGVCVGGSVFLDRVPSLACSVIGSRAWCGPTLKVATLGTNKYRTLTSGAGEAVSESARPLLYGWAPALPYKPTLRSQQHKTSGPQSISEARLRRCKYEVGFRLHCVHRRGFVGWL